jgi:ACS family glucarate transporter-like MFS transporter
MAGSFYGTGPFIAISIMTPIGGMLSDRAARRFGLTTGRRLVAMGGMLLSASSLLLGATASNINLSIVGLSIGGGAIYFALAAHWATTIDIAKEHAGTVSGFMNWGGNMGGLLSPILTPVFARSFGWTPALEVAAGIMFAGSLLWLFIQPAHRVGQHHCIAVKLP